MSYSGQSAGGSVQGAGRVVLASVLLLIGGILNIIWGIAAIGNSHFFTANAHYVFSDLHTWGWITLILGVLELCAAGSTLGRQRVWPLVRDRCGLTGDDGRAVRHALLPVLVTGGVCAEPLDPSRPLHLRRVDQLRRGAKGALTRRWPSGAAGAS